MVAITLHAPAPNVSHGGDGAAQKARRRCSGSAAAQIPEPDL